MKARIIKDGDIVSELKLEIADAFLKFDRDKLSRKRAGFSEERIKKEEEVAKIIFNNILTPEKMYPSIEPVLLRLGNYILHEPGCIYRSK